MAPLTPFLAGVRVLDLTRVLAGPLATMILRGLDPDALLARHDALVWCTITGFGPESARPGYDFVVQAERGWMAITGEPDGAPMKAGVALADILAGKDAAIAVLAALAARGRSGGGARH